MTDPYYPTPSLQTPTSPQGEPPSPVKNAFLIYVAAAVLSLISVVLVFTSGVWEQAIADAANQANANGVSAETLVNTTKTVAIVAGVLFLALYLLFAFKMRAGRNWARIVLTVLSALNILSTLTSGATKVNGRSYSAGGTSILGWIGAALAVVAIVLMYQKASNAYFAARKTVR